MFYLIYGAKIRKKPQITPFFQEKVVSLQAIFNN